MKRLTVPCMILFAAACTHTPVSPEVTVPLVVSSSTSVVSGDPLSSTHMRGDGEVPPRETDAQGQVILRIGENSIHYKVIASNIYNVVASHIHMGPPTASGPVVAFLYGTAPAGGGRHDGILAEGTITAANLVGPLAGQPFSDLVAAIRAGNTYVNVHTNDGVAPTNTGPGDFPGGEIRGQIRAKH